MLFTEKDKKNKKKHKKHVLNFYKKNIKMFLHIWLTIIVVKLVVKFYAVAKIKVSQIYLYENENGTEHRSHRL